MKCTLMSLYRKDFLEEVMPEWNLDEEQKVFQAKKEWRCILGRGRSGPQAMMCESEESLRTADILLVVERI